MKVDGRRRRKRGKEEEEEKEGYNSELPGGPIELVSVPRSDKGIAIPIRVIDTPNEAKRKRERSKKRRRRRRGRGREAHHWFV